MSVKENVLLKSSTESYIVYCLVSPPLPTLLTSSTASVGDKWLRTDRLGGNVWIAQPVDNGGHLHRTRPDQPVTMAAAIPEHGGERELTNLTNPRGSRTV